MAMPSDPNVRLFYLCAFHRKEEADVLFRAGYSTGSVYLAGYCVECILKALLLKELPRQEKVIALGEFKGRKGHDIEHLRYLCRRANIPPFPKSVSLDFLKVGFWSTELRYQAGNIPLRVAREFLNACQRILFALETRI